MVPVSTSAPTGVPDWALKVSDTAVSANEMADTAEIVGASFTAETETVTVPVFEFAVPSLARKVKLSEPL